MVGGSRHESRCEVTTSPGKIYAFGQECFVKHPMVPGAWLRTHICIAVVACPMCKAKRGEICRRPSDRFPLKLTHYRRRVAAKTAKVAVTVVTGMVELSD